MLDSALLVSTSTNLDHLLRVGILYSSRLILLYHVTAVEILRGPYHTVVISLLSLLGYHETLLVLQVRPDQYYA